MYPGFTRNLRGHYTRLQRRRNDRSFSVRDHRRRRCTDVITSTCVLVIGLVLESLINSFVEQLSQVFMLQFL